MKYCQRIPGFDGYMICRNGAVIKTNHKGRLRKLKQFERNTKVGRAHYATVKMYLEGKPKLIYVHRILALVYIPNPELKLCINHKDGDKRNNRLSNLEWVTDLENKEHARRLGLFRMRNRPSPHQMSIYSLLNEPA